MMMLLLLVSIGTCRDNSPYVGRAGSPDMRPPHTYDKVVISAVAIVVSWRLLGAPSLTVIMLMLLSATSTVISSSSKRNLVSC